MANQGDNKDYKAAYSDKKLWKKLGKFAKALGVKMTYTVLLLYYAYRRKETPRWAKTIVLGALGYLIAPIDAIPDIAPIVGYTDDLGVLSFGLVAISAYINQEVKENAKSKLSKWFGQVDDRELVEVDKRLE